MRELQRAIELNPNDANANHWYALALAAMGRFDEALLQIQRTRDIDPLAVMAHANAGLIMYLAGRFRDAIEHLPPYQGAFTAFAFSPEQHVGIIKNPYVVARVDNARFVAIE